MRFLADHQRSVRTAFVVCLMLLAFQRLGFAQPVPFVIGYVDAALLLFLVWFIYRLVRTMISTARH